MRVCLWKIRKLFQARKLALVIYGIDIYMPDVLGISESQWTHSDILYLVEGNTFVIYSGRKDDQRSEGVALVMGKRAEKSLLS